MANAAGIDVVGLAILAASNLPTAFLTSRLGWALLFLEGAAPPAVGTLATSLGVLSCNALLFAYPPLATRLPAASGG